MLLQPVKQHLQHRRRQRDFGDAIARDGFQRGLRGEVRQHDVLAPAGEQGVDGGEVCQVEHRHDMQEDGVRPAAPGHQRCQRGEADVVVAQHHALRETGGAAGVEDAGQVAAVAVRILHGVAGVEHCLVVGHAFRRIPRTRVDKVEDGRHFPGELLS
ncbi:hypothetical protein D9M68_586270 [compost metagenome]